MYEQESARHPPRNMGRGYHREAPVAEEVQEVNCACRMNIIAFTGKKQVGKSTACAYLEEKYGFTRVNFKDALIAELKENFPELLDRMVAEHMKMGWNDISSIDDLFNVKPPLIRTLMQNYGTNVRRKDDPDYWVKQWEGKVLPSNRANHTVDDCRFLNEAAAVKRVGGIIIRLIRTDMEHTDSHVSETEMDVIVPDFTIVCNGDDQEHLYAELDRIVCGS